MAKKQELKQTTKLNKSSKFKSGTDELQSCIALKKRRNFSPYHNQSTRHWRRLGPLHPSVQQCYSQSENQKQKFLKHPLQLPDFNLKVQSPIERGRHIYFHNQ